MYICQHSKMPFMRDADQELCPSRTASAWGIHLLSRSGAPPLRFSGRCLFLSEVPCGRSVIFVSLWEKRKSGFVVAHSLSPYGQGHRTALSVGTLEEAIEHLEHYCEDLSPPTAARPEENADCILSSLLDTFSNLARHDMFLNLCGSAMATWDAWLTIEKQDTD